MRGKRAWSWNNKVVILAIAAVATVAACSERSRVDPDSVVTVTGTVLDPSGAPLDDRPVRLGAGITPGEGAFAVLTVGLSCTSGNCTGEIVDATTDPSGRYRFELRGRDTQSSFGEAVPLLVSATGEVPAGHVSGPLVSARFRAQVEALELPPLALVDPALRLAGDGSVDASWEPARPGPYHVSFEQGAAVVWQVVTADTAVMIDPRVLEDATGRAVVAGSHQDSAAGTDIEVAWRSPGVGYASGAGPPPSRGRPCRATGPSGSSGSTGPCDLTDGDFEAPWTAGPACSEAPDAAGTTTCAAPTHVVVDLAEPVAAELLVLRGCDEACGLEVSDDGTTYRPAGTAAGEFSAVGLDGRPVRAVRVDVTAAPRLREVSVWGPLPSGPALERLDARERDRIAERFAPGGREPFPLVVVAAAAALAVSLVLLGFAIGRRRSSR